MSKSLGIGVRVWIGWTPVALCPEASHLRLKTGTVAQGPHPAGVYADQNGRRVEMASRWWVVDVDVEDGQGSWIVEHLLTPIDDDLDAAEPRVEETPEDVHA